MLLTVALLVAGALLAGASPPSSSLADQGSGTVLDLVLVATVDGLVHALRVEDGEESWSFSSGPALVSSFSSPSTGETLVPSLDGSLFLRSSPPSSSLLPLAMDMPQLVHSAPFVSSQGRLVTAHKTARMFALDASTGSLRMSFSAQAGSCSPSSASRAMRSLLLGRADYVVSAVHASSGHLLWNCSYSALLSDGEVPQSSSSLPVRLSLSSSSSSSLEARSPSAPPSSPPLWSATLPSQPVSIFEVHQASSGLLVLLEILSEASSSSEPLFVGLHRGQHYVVPHSSPLSFDPQSKQLATLGEQSLFTGFHPVLPLPTPPTWEIPVIAPPVLDQVEEDDEGLDVEDVLLLLGFFLAATLLIALLVRLLRPRAPVVEPAEPRSLGGLEICEDRVLGFGSGGTMVYEGTLNGRQVAVKRMLHAFFDLAEQETNVLLQADEHPNVVSYYTREEDDNFVYLALSFCEMTLDSLVQDYPERIEAHSRHILRGLCQGLAHLHELHVVHRDLKPANVLVLDSRSLTVKLSDMGLAKRLAHAQQSFSSRAPGTQGWQAPELLREQNEGEPPSRQTMAQDIFSLGCLMFFVLTAGQHPFGGRVEREARILAGRMDLSALDGHPVVQHLIANCVAKVPERRFSSQQVLEHPYWWTAEQRLHFLMGVSDLLEVRDSHLLEKRAARILGQRPWRKSISYLLVKDLAKHRRYNNSVKDLLRVIRNKAHHYRDLAPPLKRVLGEYPEGLLGYFERLFPALFLACYKLYHRDPTFDSLKRSSAAHVFN